MTTNNFHPCVLLVEDDPDIRMIVRLLLETQYGSRVVESVDGITAPELALNEKPTLILMDLVLPETNGFEVSRDIHCNRDTQHIPIIMVSDKCWDVRIQYKAKEIGCVDCIDKSHLMDQLPGKVAPYLGAARHSGVPGSTFG